MVGKKRILVTGGTGLLGKGLEETAPPNASIIGVHLRPYEVEDPKATHLRVDIRDRQEVGRLFKEYEFDAVIHAAGIASVDYVETHFAESMESNLDGTRHIAEACRRQTAYLIYVSTNAVFSGEEAPYGEEATPRPINKYGRIKLKCEECVAKTLEQFSIVRPILMYGWNHAVGRSNPATWIIEKLRRGEPLHMVNDVYENPLYNIQCGKAIWRIAHLKPAGIFHLGGATSLNRHEFARKVADVFGLDPGPVRPVDSSYFHSIAPRPKNTSFVTRKMQKALGVKPMTVDEGLRLMKRTMKIIS